jgi:hypothetical protein
MKNALPFERMNPTLKPLMFSWRKSLTEQAASSGGKPTSGPAVVPAIRMRRTYPVTSTTFGGSEGQITKYIDPNSPAFRARVLARIAEENKSIEHELELLRSGPLLPKDFVVRRHR